jgi:Zn-dependent M28 family amino/carboxypeptidase
MRRFLFSAAAPILIAWAPVWGRADAVSNVIDQFTTAEYQSYLRVLTGVEPAYTNPHYYLTNRYSHSLAGQIAGDWLLDRFQSFGLAAQQDIFDYFYAPNVIAELPGTSRPDDIYVICAHYDTWHAQNQQLAPGCDDNASGTAAVLAAARILSQYQFEGTIRFIAFSGEEQWMVGSQAYAQAARAAGENIVAAINLDMILHPGFDNAEPDPDYDLDIESNAASLWLAQHLAAQYAAYTPIDFEIHVGNDLVSDHWAFWQYDYDAIGLSENTVFEIWGGSNDAYHELSDTLDNPDYDWEFARHTVRGGLAGLVTLAGLVPEPRTLEVLAALALLARRCSRAPG